MRVLDLFSGIGGFSLGLERAGMQTVAFCEFDKKAQLVLKKHWPDVPIYDDVRELTYDKLKEDGIVADSCGGKRGDSHGLQSKDSNQRKKEGKPDRVSGFSHATTRGNDKSQGQSIDLICGGFPCQPFSQAGKRKGDQDDRHLWPEYFRLIQEIRPRWVIGENVAGLISMGLDQVLSDLESEDYSCQTLVIPACAVNAPHRRDRVWILANSEGNGRDGSVNRDNELSERAICKDKQNHRHTVRSQTQCCGTPYPDVGYSKHNGSSSAEECGNIVEAGKRGEEESKQTVQLEGTGGQGCDETLAYSDNGFELRENNEIQTGGNTVAIGSQDVADSISQRGCGGTTGKQDAGDVRESPGCSQGGWWNIEPDVGRVAHGIPNRVDRLKQLGNAVVPQVVEEIGRAIMKVEHEKVS